ncbi:MAG: hypothetical protein ABI462_12780 [Ignavibacteria bacterium]
MHKSSLLEIIRTFTQKELIKFDDFVNSPYFNKNKNVINLFIEIKKYAPDFAHNGLEKELLWEKIFPGKEYNYGIMKNLIFDLNKLAEQYIISMKFNEDEPLHSKYLLRGLFDRYMQDYFFKTMVAAERKYNMKYFLQKNYESADYFRFRAELKDFDFTYQQHFKVKTNLIEKYNLNSANLISEFFIEIFKTYNNIEAESVNRNSDVSNNPIVFFLKYVMKDKFEMLFDKLKNISGEGYDVLKIYFLMFESLSADKNASKYFDFKDCVLNSRKYLSDSEMRSLHSCLINSYTFDPPEGTNSDIELLEIFDYMIEKNIIKRPGERWIEEHVFS